MSYFTQTPPAEMTSKYVFGYYSNSDKCWYVPPRKFETLNDINRGILSGMFLQSSWFQEIYKINETGLFIVLKINYDMSTKTIEKDMNGLDNPFPSYYDVPPYVLRVSYFQLNWDIINGCLKKLEENKDSVKFTARATNNPYDKLTLSMYYNKNNKESMFVTKPQFEFSRH